MQDIPGQVLPRQKESPCLREVREKEARRLPKDRVGAAQVQEAVGRKLQELLAK